MSASPAVLVPTSAVEEDIDMLETAFSRLPKGSHHKRRAYGLAMDIAASPQGKTNSNNIMNSTDLLSTDMTQPDHGAFLFSDNNNDDDDGYPSDIDKGGDNDVSDDDETVDMSGDVLKSNEKNECEEDEIVSDQSSESEEENVSDEEEEEENQVGRGRSLRASTLESNGQPPTPVKPVQETAAEEAPTKEEMTTTQVKASPIKADTTSDEEHKGKPQEEDGSEEEPVKEQPDQESLITSIDNLFVHADKATVTVRDIVRSLEAEYDVKFEKPTKGFVRSHLTDLIKGHVEPTVESTEPMKGSEEEEESVVGGSESSDYEEEDEEDEIKKKQKPCRKPTKPKKRTSARRTPATKKPSHIRIHAEMLRKRRIEELKVRNEELQLKQSKEDQQRAEQIAARFETNTEELRLKRLEDRLDLLLKLDQKRIQVINVDLVSVEITTEVTKKDDQVPSSTPTEESDSEDDFELEIIGKDEPVSKSLPKAAGVKSSALSMLDMVCGMKPDANKKSKEHRSPGKTMTARADLRNVLLAKQRKAGNMWLARELGYKTEEDHLRDCKLVEHKKREVVVKKEEERVRANERKQLRERLMTESSQYDAEEEEGPNDVENKTEERNGDDGDESDEEMAMAREIETEQRAEDTPQGSFDVPTSADDEMNEPKVEPEADNKVDGDRKEEGESLTEVPMASTKEAPLSTDVASPDAIMQGEELGGNAKSDTVDEDRMMAADIPSDVVTDTGNASPPSQGSEPSEDVSKAKDSVPVPSFEAIAGTEDHHASEGAMEDEDENEFQEEDSDDADTEEEPKDSTVKKDKNSGWRAMLQKEAETIKKLKARKSGKGLVEAEADEEEEEEIAGLEDFGFSLNKKKEDDEEEDDIDADKLTEEDLKHVVDDVSDDEGDEEAGETARMELEQKEERERHKDIIRRMRDGYDGRRGGIAGGGVGARGIHRFDQLVAADNRDDARRLGLLNDDEFDSDDDGAKDDSNNNNDDEIDDENALLDKVLKDRFLHRSSDNEIEEKFSDDEDEEEDVSDGKLG
jgi:hypothetical protein